MTSNPTTDELIKAAATYLQGDSDDVEERFIVAFIEHWLASQGLIAVEVPERPGSSFVKVEIKQAPSIP